MTYTFIGHNSLGYKHGQKYTLTLKQRRFIWAIPHTHEAKPCPYESWEAFYKNWRKD